MDSLLKNGIVLEYNKIVYLCKKYNIKELSIFGSSIRDDFTHESDIDILVSFNKNAETTLFDIIDLEKELENILKRSVDVVEKEALKNPIRRQNILSTREIVYAA
jgi:predicted nucleotidyltransferase